VAEGEVADVVTALKALVAAAGGTITTEEAPQRFELAYPIDKRFEGKFRSFKSAYFGWIRFTATPDVVTGILREVEGRQDILRALLVKLTAAEVAHPFYFHEALAQKRVVTVDATTPEQPEEVTAEAEEGEAEEEATDEAKD
jgi:ribosomal protein S6